MACRAWWGACRWSVVALAVLGAACAGGPAGRSSAPPPQTASPLLGTPTSAAALTAPTATPTAVAEAPTAALDYLRQALDFIAANAVQRDTVDWTQERAAALARATGASPVQSTADTYPIIRGVLRDLHDHHSQLLDPTAAAQLAQGMSSGTGLLALPQGPDWVVVQVVPESPADRAGVRVGDTLLGSRPSATQLHVRRAGQSAPIDIDVTPGRFSTFVAPQTRALGTVGYVRLPGFTGTPQQADAYVAAARAGMAALEPTTTCGWMVDLRTNTGGNGYPMNAAIAMLMPDGPGGAFVAGSSRQPWSFKDGQFVAAAGVQSFGLPPPGPLVQADAPVAVLTGPLTGSSGEWVLVSFLGRPRTRSFGSPTAGVPTANTVKPMPDGALLVLTVALDADRTGQVYDAAIPPDQPVQPDWTAFGTDADPVIQAAQEWLQQQPSCRDHESSAVDRVVVGSA